MNDVTATSTTDETTAEAVETTTTAEAAPRTGFGAVLHAVNRFRRTRPFWGSIILALGGWFVLKPVVASASMTLELGVGGVSGYVLGAGMIFAALVSFFLPKQRHFPALMAVVMSVASLPLANLGGWLIGMTLGIIGSGMVFAWTPYSDKQLAKFAARSERRDARRAARRTPDAVAA